MTTPNKPVAAGIDIGHSAVKISCGDFRCLFPAVATPAFSIIDASTASAAKNETVKVNGKDWFFGDTALDQTTNWATGLTDDWINSQEHSALFLGAIKKLNDAGIENPKFIVVGLPVQAIKSDHEIKNKLTDQLSKLLPEAQIAVVPQPYGAYFDLTLLDGGTPNPEQLAHIVSWAVIDVGFYTTDFIIIKEGKWIEMASLSCQGISMAAEKLIQSLAAKNIKINMSDADKALLKNSIMDYGRKIDISVETTEALEFASSKIVDEAERLFASYVSRLTGVLVTGGGAPVIKKAISDKWKHAFFPENNRLSVVNGMRKRAEHMAAKSLQKKN